MCFSLLTRPIISFFFFNDTATTEIYTLSLHDALPICQHCHRLLSQGRSDHVSDPGGRHRGRVRGRRARVLVVAPRQDRKSTRLNSSHLVISYAVFCLKKKKNKNVLLYIVDLLVCSTNV